MTANINSVLSPSPFTSDCSSQKKKNKRSFVTLHEVNYNQQGGGRRKRERGRRRHRGEEINRVKGGWRECKEGGKRRGTNEWMYGFRRMTGRRGGVLRFLTGLIRHLGYCSPSDRHPSSHSEKFTGRGPTLNSDGFLQYVVKRRSQNDRCLLCRPQISAMF